ncbi:hypothetical protein PILCRDRAFT_748704 [Piloderma croceum F 1598]|uniref:Uncharacterized protein n=1 Tax=Piloderma croceum (strain F 1598) TaxID=765440 RepID=A0A0C3EUU9_PILCF|nr:hypothetical protein PILCRDRAFT_748704 [Piloderma croceum F 1598]
MKQKCQLSILKPAGYLLLHEWLLSFGPSLSGWHTVSRHFIFHLFSRNSHKLIHFLQSHACRITTLLAAFTAESVYLQPSVAGAHAHWLQTPLLYVQTDRASNQVTVETKLIDNLADVIACRVSSTGT